MKGARMTKQQLKASKVADINRRVIDELEKPAKKKKANQLPNQPAPQVMWMWGKLVGWSLATGIYVKREHKFHDHRLWRFDFALPDRMIGIEYDGLVSEKSRHTTLTGFTGDTEKINAAQVMGWRVIRFTVKNYKTVITALNELIENDNKSKHGTGDIDIQPV